MVVVVVVTLAVVVVRVVRVMARMIQILDTVMILRIRTAVILGAPQCTEKTDLFKITSPVASMVCKNFVVASALQTLQAEQKHFNPKP